MFLFDVLTQATKGWFATNNAAHVTPLAFAVPISLTTLRMQVGITPAPTPVLPQGRSVLLASVDCFFVRGAGPAALPVQNTTLGDATLAGQIAGGMVLLAGNQLPIWMPLAGEKLSVIAVSAGYLDITSGV